MPSTAPQTIQLVSCLEILPFPDVEIFFHALESNHYNCWLPKEQALPMIYIDDCVDATIKYLKAPKSQLQRSVYNLAGVSFTPEMLGTEV